MSGRPKKGEEAPCAVCRSGYRRTIDALLEDGHTYLCLSREWRRRGIHLSPQHCARHHASHVPSFTVPTPLPVLDWPWWYVAPWPDPQSRPTSPEIVLIRGLPGTGKSRFATRFQATHRHLEADQFFR